MHNTFGDRCQYCLPGFVGDATRGTPEDCQSRYDIYRLDATTRSLSINKTCNIFGTAQIVDGKCECKVKYN